MIGRPRLLSALLGVALSTGLTMKIVLELMANLVEPSRPSLAGVLLKVGGRGLALADPLLTRGALRSSERTEGERWTERLSR